MELFDQKGAPLTDLHLKNENTLICPCWCFRFLNLLQYRMQIYKYFHLLSVNSFIYVCIHPTNAWTSAVGKHWIHSGEQNKDAISWRRTVWPREWHKALERRLREEGRQGKKKGLFLGLNTRSWLLVEQLMFSFFELFISYPSFISVISS